MYKILIVIALTLSLFSTETKKQKTEVKPEFKCEGKDIARK